MMVLTKTFRYFYRILQKTCVCRHVFVKSSDMKLHEALLSGSRALCKHTDRGQTDRHG
jgi:hypothetical protein